ncbi:hypothetical protein PNH50_05200 [Leisingera aquaemixtae]|uniref:hypothetical protein n=1 Tax=Leisingera aquaemixtae TaxID=1396826 RepID=UPI00398404CF
MAELKLWESSRLLGVGKIIGAIAAAGTMHSYALGSTLGDAIAPLLDYVFWRGVFFELSVDIVFATFVVYCVELAFFTVGSVVSDVSYAAGFRKTNDVHSIFQLSPSIVLYFVIATYTSYFYLGNQLNRFVIASAIGAAIGYGFRFVRNRVFKWKSEKSGNYKVAAGDDTAISNVRSREDAVFGILAAVVVLFYSHELGKLKARSFLDEDPVAVINWSGGSAEVGLIGYTSDFLILTNSDGAAFAVPIQSLNSIEELGVKHGNVSPKRTELGSE